MMMRRRRQLTILSQDEIQKMREAGRVAAELLCHLGEMVEPGISTQALNDEAERWGEAHGVTHAPKGYKGFPRSICTSINEVICHGIPTADRILLEGDIISIDVTPVLDGFHGDTCATFFVGEVSPEARKLVEVTAQCLMRGVKEIRPGRRIGDIGAAIQAHAEPKGFSVVRDFIGHGVGRAFHGAPEVPHYGTRNTGLRFRPGMAFTVEPMINAGDYPVQILDDDWTALTRDRSLSAQFEHTLVVTPDGVEAMTCREGEDPFKVAPGGQIKFDEIGL
jgi:methionyl aminopeptidase